MSVVDLQVQPKSHVIRHGRHKITVTYKPNAGCAAERWHWRLDYVVEQTFDGYCQTQDQAEKMAKRYIQFRSALP